MRIAVLSDTHGQVERVQKALTLIAAAGAELILHCGDIDDVDTVRVFPRHTHFVFGNCDHDRAALREAIEAIGAQLDDSFGHVVIEGKTIAFTHGDDRYLMRDLENSGAYDYLFHGHTHKAFEYRAGRTRVINPGALQRAHPKTFILLDLPAGTIQTQIVDD